MANYYTVHILLTKKQSNELIHHLSAMIPFHLILKPSQIDNDKGEAILCTKSQLQKLITAKQNKKSAKIILSRSQLKKIHEAMMNGEGILDSISNLFSSAKSWVSNKFSTKNQAIGKMPTNTYTRKNTTTFIPNTPKDLGPKYDHMPPGYKPPKQTTFDRIAEKVSNFDKGIDKFFGYGGNSGGIAQPWKQQKLGYSNAKEDF